MVKRIFLALISLIVILSSVSCGEPKYKHCELVIPLDSDFKETENENFDATFTNGETIVAIVRISFVAAYSEGIPETLTPSEFGKFWLKKCARDAELINEDGISYSTYTEEQNGREYFYLESFLRSHSAYFVVLFATESSNKEEGRAEFLSYTKGIYFVE